MNKGAIQQFHNTLPLSQGPEDETGFLENVRAAFNVAWDEDRSISRFFNKELYDERNNRLDQMIKSGEIPKAEAEKYSDLFGYDYRSMAYDMKRKGYDINDDYELLQATRATLREQREAAEDVHRRANISGMAGMFTGSMGALMSDPVNLGSMLIPGLGMARTASMAARVGKTALYYGATGVAAETAIQASVAPYKNHIRSEYTMGDAITNIALAGVGEAVLGTGIELGVDAVRNGFKSVKKNIEASEPPEVAEPLIKEIEQAEAEYEEIYEQVAKEYDEAPPDADIPLDEQPIGETPDTIEPVAFEPVELETVRELDPINREVAKRMDEITEAEEDIMLGNADEAMSEKLSELDTDEFMEMSQAERDAMISEILGEDFDLADVEVEVETGTLNADGEMQYTPRKAEDIITEFDDQTEMLNNFINCWNGDG